MDYIDDDYLKCVNELVESRIDSLNKTKKLLSESPILEKPVKFLPEISKNIDYDDEDQYKYTSQMIFNQLDGLLSTPTSSNSRSNSPFPFSSSSPVDNCSNNDVEFFHNTTLQSLSSPSSPHFPDNMEIKEVNEIGFYIY
jgi:hypothetical protein